MSPNDIRKLENLDKIPAKGAYSYVATQRDFDVF
jgi:hypothetical protein